MAKSNLKISLLIVTKGRWQKLKACLLAVKFQTSPADETIIVINGPKKIPPAITKLAFQIKNSHIVYETKLGIPQARNKAIRKSSFNYLLFIDDDSILDKKAIQNLKSTWQSHQKAIAIQGMALNYNSGNLVADTSYLYYQDWLQRHNQDKYLSILDTKIASLNKNNSKTPIKFESQWAPFHCGEDIHLGQQILSKGGKIIYSKKIKAFHFEPTSVKHFLIQRHKHGRMAAKWEQTWDQALGRNSQQKQAFLITWTHHFSNSSKRLFLSGLLILAGIISYNFGYWQEHLVAKKSHEK